MERELADYSYFPHNHFPVNPHTEQLSDEDWDFIQKLRNLIRQEGLWGNDCRNVGPGCPFLRVGVIPWSKTEENGILFALGLDRRTQEYSDFGGAMHQNQRPYDEALREFYEETLGFEVVAGQDTIVANSGNCLTLFVRVQDVRHVQQHFRFMSRYYTAAIEQIKGKSLLEYYTEDVRKRVFNEWYSPYVIFPEMADIEIVSLRQFRELVLFPPLNPSFHTIVQRPPNRGFTAYPNTLWERIRMSLKQDWNIVEKRLMEAPNWS